jgi:ABC-2 type transport system ATP-binding protein
VVFLDEPTIGMDVVVKEQVRRLLRHEVEQRGRAVLLTTHDMTEVERLAERVVLINHGRIVMDGTLTEIRARFGEGWRVHATIQGPAEPCPPGLAVLSRDGATVVFGPGAEKPVAEKPVAEKPVAEKPVAENPVTVPQALKLIIERYEVADVRVAESDLEDVMRAAYR